jgi:hypothetical protein
MVRGELPGAEVFTGQVTANRRVVGNTSQRSGEKFSDQCDLQLRAIVDDKETNTREWATEPECTTLFGVGQPATLVRLPEDSELYLRDGTWASVGNGEFDRVLLLVERGVGAGLLLFSLLLLGAAALAGRPRRARV